MNIDIRTLVIITGITGLLQVMELFLQFRLNKSHQGIGWWTLSFGSMVMGYGFIALHGLISIKLITIISPNPSLLKSGDGKCKKQGTTMTSVLGYWTFKK
jgi:hypothetical protein